MQIPHDAHGCIVLINVIDGKPDGGRFLRREWPVLRVLMPRNLRTIAWVFDKKLPSPLIKVSPQHRLHITKYHRVTAKAVKPGATLVPHIHLIDINIFGKSGRKFFKHFLQLDDLGFSECNEILNVTLFVILQQLVRR